MRKWKRDIKKAQEGSGHDDPIGYCGHHFSGVWTCSIVESVEIMKTNAFLPVLPKRFKLQRISELMFKLSSLSQDEQCELSWYVGQLVGETMRSLMVVEQAYLNQCDRRVRRSSS